MTAENVFLSPNHAVVFEIFEIFPSRAQKQSTRDVLLLLFGRENQPRNYFRELKFGKYPRDVKTSFESEKSVVERIKITD